jgi:hypothetical protein
MEGLGIEQVKGGKEVWFLRMDEWKNGRMEK